MIQKVNITGIKNNLKYIAPGGEYIETFEKCIKDIRNICTIDMRNYWQDDAYNNTFEPKMEEFLEELTKVKEQVESYYTCINNYVEAVSLLNSTYNNKNISNYK